MDQREPHLPANRVVAPELRHPHLVIEAQASCDVHGRGWHIQVEWSRRFGQVGPLSQRLEMVYGLTRFNLYYTGQSPPFFCGVQDEIRVQGRGADPDRCLLLVAGIGHDLASAPPTGL
jgi:hypothetical protein